MRKSVARGADSLTSETHLRALELEQAVDGLGETAGGLGEALGGAAGGRGEVHAGLLGLQNLDEGAQNRGFARARAAGEDAELVREGVVQRGALEVVELEAGLLLRPGDGGLDLDGRQARGHGGEAADDLGDLALGAVVRRELQEGLRIADWGLRIGGMADDGLVLQQCIDARLQQLGGGFE
jgi:hypothetical protein